MRKGFCILFVILFSLSYLSSFFLIVHGTSINKYQNSGILTGKSIVQENEKIVNKSLELLTPPHSHAEQKTVMKNITEGILNSPNPLEKHLNHLF